MDWEVVGVQQSKENLSWCAGLFDGEGNVNLKQYRVKKTGTNRTCLKWNVGMEVAMTCIDTIHHFYSIVQDGNIHAKPPGKGSLGKKLQWRWRCSHQKALRIAKLLYPYSVTKRPVLLNIINHYELKPIKKAADVLGQNNGFLRRPKSN
jgi:hypothetical protein